MNGIFKWLNVTNHLESLKGYRMRGGPVARADIQKAIRELEKKKDLAGKQVLDIHSVTASTWEQMKSQTAVAMDDHRDSLTRTLSHFPPR
jgi:predicted short-subunit dehydrogenase-like oxidoreductase (DUF2520 family)